MVWDNALTMQNGGSQLDGSGLFGRVVSILETSRANVVRSVNSEMVAAYWLIGREIVEEGDSPTKEELEQALRKERMMIEEAIAHYGGKGYGG